MNDTGPYEEGKLAASEGMKLKDNPYEKDTDEYDLWREGFKSDDDEGRPGNEDDESTTWS